MKKKMLPGSVKIKRGINSSVIGSMSGMPKALGLIPNATKRKM